MRERIGKARAGDERGDSVTLKTTPPRLPAVFVERKHLSLARLALSGMQVFELAAPDGFGKTAQLAQWHLEAVLAGSCAMWVSLDERDVPTQLVAALTCAGARGAGRGYFTAAFSDWISASTDVRQALTAWLAEIARLPRDALLILDDVDSLPVATRHEAIDYLVANAPSNLRVAIATRPGAALSVTESLRGTPMIRITARELRLSQQETIDAVLLALDKAGSTEQAIDIHAITEGWPLGIRLATAAHLGQKDGAPEAPDITADLRHYFRDAVIGPLPAATRDMLVAAAWLDPLHPDLCAAVAGRAVVIDELEQLADRSPMLTGIAESQWFRLHPLARDLLQGQHGALPRERQRIVASIARDWYEQRDMLEEGAQQARLAGDEAGAIALIETGLRSMTQQGRHGEVLQWLERMPGGALSQHPGFWAPAAWALALSDRLDEVHELVDLIVERQSVTIRERYEAGLILSACAGFRDDAAQLEHFAAAWPEPPADALTSDRMIHAVSVANAAIMDGRPEAARRLLREVAPDDSAVSPVSRGFVDLEVGISYLWEGRPQLAHDMLGPALSRAERDMDRWNRASAMLGAALARACVDLDRLDEARQHLALRLPIIEKQGVPDTVIFAHTALAEMADADGRQDQSLEQLAALAAIGRTRGIVRMEAAAGFAVTRLHMRHARHRMATEESARLSARIAALDTGLPEMTHAWCAMFDLLAQAVAVAPNSGTADIRAGLAAAHEALALAGRLGRGQELVFARYLLIDLNQRAGTPVSTDERQECDSFCLAAGLHRLRGEWSPAALTAPPATPPPAPSIDRRSILTAREHDILTRLARYMSNKEIALSLGVGEETVKWHMKNLFLKLDAGDRKGIVVRARTLGLLID